MRSAVLTLAGLLVAGLAFAEEDEAKTPLTRIVEVVRADDTPVADATVEAWGLPGGTAKKRTGADGLARFENMPRKGIVYVARKAGFCCGWHEPGRWWWTPPPEDRDPDGDGITRVRLVLVPGTVVQGRVLAKDGQTPVAGAVIEAREEAHATDLWTLEGAPFWTATTDAEGRFRTTEHWPALPKGVKDEKLVSAVLVVRAAGWISERTEVWPAHAGKQRALTFELLPAVTIRGAVTDPDGRPAAGAAVHAYPPDSWGFAGHRDTRDTHPREMHVHADARGNYAFPEAFPGVRYRVFAEASSGKRVMARSRMGTAPCDLSLRRLGSLRVWVEPDEIRDTFGHDCVPPPGTRPWAFDHKQDDGSVLVRDADPGRWTIRVSAPGWADHRSVVEVGEGEDKTVRIRLTRGAAVEGVVVDDTGAPVRDAVLYAYAIDPEDPDRTLPGYQQTRTDEHGRFRLTGLRAGRVSISAGVESLQADGDTRVVAPGKDVRIVLYAPAKVRFRLKPPEGGAAPTRVRVTVTRLAGAYRGSQWQDTVDASNGCFEIADQMPGPVWLAVEARGYAPFLTRLEIKPRVLNEPAPFALSRGLSLRGRVVDGAGRPVAGARIVAWGNPDNAVETGRRGAFEVPHLAPGSVELSVTAQGMAMALLSARVAQDGESLVVVLTPGGLVRGTLVDRTASGGLASIDFFPAAAKDDNVSRWRAEVADGAFSIRLPPGRYRCALPRPGVRRGPTVFDVGEGGEVVLELEYR